MRISLSLCSLLDAASQACSSSSRSVPCVSQPLIHRNIAPFDQKSLTLQWESPGRNQALVRRLEKGLDWASILAGAMGAVALILLSVLDTARHPSLHRLFLLLFMLGVVLSALFTTLEYRRLGKMFIERSFLKLSYRFKQAIVVLEVCL